MSMQRCFKVQKSVVYLYILNNSQCIDLEEINALIKFNAHFISVIWTQNEPKTCFLTIKQWNFYIQSKIFNNYVDNKLYGKVYFKTKLFIYFIYVFEIEKIIYFLLKNLYFKKK